MAQRLSREEFRRWAAGREQHYGRIGSDPVAMSPERIARMRVTSSCVRAALDRAIRSVNP